MRVSPGTSFSRPQDRFAGVPLQMVPVHEPTGLRFFILRLPFLAVRGGAVAGRDIRSA